MSIPPKAFGQLGKAAKAAEVANLDEVITVGGRTTTRRAMLEFEIEKRLGWGQSQSDIMKSLEQQGFGVVDPNFVKERMAVARRRNETLKPDPRYAGMEASWIIQNGLNNGMSWDEIAGKLIDGGFNGPKLVEIAKQKQAAQVQNGSGPAVIDKRFSNQAAKGVVGGAAVTGGAGMGELEPAAQTHPTQDLKGLADMSQEELSDYLMEGFKEAKSRGLKMPEGAAPTPLDWDGLEQLGQFWKEDIVRSNQVDPNTDMTEGADTGEGAARRPPPPETGVDLLIPGNNM